MRSRSIRYFTCEDLEKRLTDEIGLDVRNDINIRIKTDGNNYRLVYGSGQTLVSLPRMTPLGVALDVFAVVITAGKKYQKNKVKAKLTKFIDG